MNKTLWIGVAVASVVLAAVAGLLLYQNVQQERVLAEVRAQADASRAQIGQIASQQEQIASQQEKIRRTLSETQDARAADRGYLLIRDDLTAVAGMRVAITEFYAATGRMPATHADMGLPAPDQYRGKSLRSATLLPGGRIELVFDAQSGIDGGRIWLVPDLAHAAAMGIQWRCETPDYPLIRRALPTCDYTPVE
jgi:hypothetical protein